MKSFKKEYFIIGIDEAGRGPLAGPLVVGGVLLIVNNFKEEWEILKGIRDSKKLSAKKREEWFATIKKHSRVHMAYAVISPKIIDKINIWHAANLGANKVYQRLLRRFLSITHIASGRLLCGLLVINKLSKERGGTKGGIEVECNSRKIKLKTLLDGGLRLKEGIPCEIIIKGDEKIPSIAAASIVAKVIRDRYMSRLHQKFPEYGFDRHKGYGTKMHKATLIRFGISAVHRTSFLKKIT